MPKIVMAENMARDGIQVGGHKYARGFLHAGWQVFWLANFLNVNRLLRRREDDRLYAEGWRSGVVSPAHGLYTYTPFTLLPYIKLRGLDSRYVADRSLRYTWPGLSPVLRRAGFGKVDVLWITHPRLASILDLVEHDLLVYRMADDVAQFGQEPRTITEVEQAICRRADIVFCTAHSLLEKARRWGANATYLSNGVDFDLFNGDQAAEPADLAHIPRPRLLYVGAISDWLDVDLLLAAAQRRRDLSFILVGPITGSGGIVGSLERLGREPNVYVLGSKPFSQVPAYMRFGDIGLIPFRVNPLTHGVNPIKLFEYSACGLPVVTADLHETRRLGSPALIYQSLDMFFDCVELALAGRVALREQGISFARRNSWQSRFELVEQELCRLRSPTS
jgi:glycosyltransferase involved in cell wall biosynthesis